MNASNVLKDSLQQWERAELRATHFTHCEHSTVIISLTLV